MAIVTSPPAESAFLANLIRVYQIGLGRQPDLQGLEYWFAQGKANGLDIGKIASGFLPVEVLQHTPERFLSDLYHSALGRDADADGYAFWLGQIKSGAMSYQKVMLSFALSSEFTTNTATGVADVISKATAGLPIDTSKPLGGVPAYDYTPHPPIVVEVPVEVIKEVVTEVPVFVDRPVAVPTAEAHTISVNFDGSVSILAQKPNGEFLAGSGNPATGFLVVTDQTNNVEMALRPFHRQSGEDVDPIAYGQNGSRGWAEYNLDAGRQDGDHGAPINLNRADASVHAAISGAPGFMTDGDTRYVMTFSKDINPGAGDTWQVINTLTLSAQPNGAQVWVDKNGNVAIGDDPVSTTAATNSMNFAFAYMLGTADAPAGRYMLSIDQVSLVGLAAGQSVSGADAIINLV